MSISNHIRMEHSFNTYGITSMINDENWLNIQYNERKASKNCDIEQPRKCAQTQTTNINTNTNRPKIPNFIFPGPQTGSETSTAINTNDRKCKCSSFKPISFVQAYRKRMQYERLGIPITVEEVLAMRKFNCENSNKTPKPESQDKSEKPERFHDTSTQTDLNQYLNNNNNEPISSYNAKDDDINLKSDHSHSEEKKYFTTSQEQEEDSKIYRNIGEQEYQKSTSRTRPSSSSEMPSVSDERPRGSERKSGITKRSLSSKAERNSRREIRSSDLKNSNYLNHRSSAKYCSNEFISSDEESNSKTQTKRAPSTQTKNYSYSHENTKTSKNFYGGNGHGPKQKSESDDIQSKTYSNVQTKRAPFCQSKNFTCACESTKANYLYRRPDPNSNDIQNSTDSNVRTFQSKPKSQFKSKSSKCYHFNVDSDPKSDDNPCMPNSRVQTNRFGSYQAKFRNYSSESTMDSSFYDDSSDTKSKDMPYVPHTRTQTKHSTSFQPKFGKTSCDSKCAYHHHHQHQHQQHQHHQHHQHHICGPDQNFNDTHPCMPHASKVPAKLTTSFEPKYRTNSCDSTKAKYMNRSQEQKPDTIQFIFTHPKLHSKCTSSKWDCTQSSDEEEETQPSDSSEPEHRKFFREACAKQMTFDKNMLHQLTKDKRKTTSGYPYEDILKSLNLDEQRPSPAPTRCDKHNCCRCATREKDTHREYLPRRYGKSEQNSYSPSNRSVNPLQCKYNVGLADSEVDLQSSGTITGVPHKNQINSQRDDRLSGGLWKNRISSCNVNSKSHCTSKYKTRYIGHWDDLLNAMKTKNVSKHMTLLREFQFFAEFSFKRSNMHNDFSWHGINATAINSELCKCPVGSRNCHPFLNESLLSHFIHQHLNEPGIELCDIFEKDRFLLIFDANALQIGKNACMSVLMYGGFRGQSVSQPALRFMPVINTDLPKSFAQFRGYLPLMLMICRFKRNALPKSLLAKTNHTYSYSSSRRKRVRFADDDPRSRKNNDDDDDVIIIWVASMELPEPLYVMLTVFDKAMTTTRTSIVKVRSIMKSHKITDFKNKDETHVLLSDSDMEILSSFNAIYLEMSIHEYFHDYPCVQH